MHLRLNILIAIFSLCVLAFHSESSIAQELTEATPETTEDEDSVAAEIEYENESFGDGEEVDGTINYLLPYRSRRAPWSTVLSLGASNFSPEDYIPNASIDNFQNHFGVAEVPLFEISITAKKNYSWVSAGLDLGVGYYQNGGKNESTLTLIPVRVGASLAFDTLFQEPYVVPYGSVGGYIIAYRDSTASQAVSGNTELALYFAFGLRMQLDWIDRDGDFSSYDEQNIENSFLYVEAQNFAEPAPLVPNLSSPGDTPLQISAGLSLEF